MHVGPTPVAAVGATDQHSQVQLFMEGPFDKVITFVDGGRPRSGCPDPELPGSAPLPPDLAYLPGHTLGELLRAEYEATSTALARDGADELHPAACPISRRPALGEAIMFFQLATGYAGAWYGIDPFDQPGVELGKRLTYAAMGRPGYEAELAASRRLGPTRCRPANALRLPRSRPTFGRDRMSHCVQEDRHAWLMQHSR